MTHIAIQEALDRNNVARLEKVTFATLFVAREMRFSKDKLTIFNFVRVASLGPSAL
jgi:hypothetical protein